MKHRKISHNLRDEIKSKQINFRLGPSADALLDAVSIATGLSKNAIFQICLIEYAAQHAPKLVASMQPHLRRMVSDILAELGAGANSGSSMAMAGH